jgi:hypothetical protein
MMMSRRSPATGAADVGTAAVKLVDPDPYAPTPLKVGAAI